MNWAQRLKRVFNIDAEVCDQCGGTVKLIACIEDPVVIRKILDHLESSTNRTGATATKPGAAVGQPVQLIAGIDATWFPVFLQSAA